MHYIVKLDHWRILRKKLWLPKSNNFIQKEILGWIECILFNFPFSNTGLMQSINLFPSVIILETTRIIDASSEIEISIRSKINDNYRLPRLNNVAASGRRSITRKKKVWAKAKRVRRRKHIQHARVLTHTYIHIYVCILYKPSRKRKRRRPVEISWRQSVSKIERECRDERRADPARTLNRLNARDGGARSFPPLLNYTYIYTRGLFVRWLLCNWNFGIGLLIYREVVLFLLVCGN